MQTSKGRFYYPVKTHANLRDMIQESLRLFGSQKAFTFRNDPAAQPQSRTYREFVSDYQALGSILRKLGYSNKKISVIGENSYSWCVTHTAVLSGVGISVPLDRLLPGEEIISLLERGSVSAVFYDANYHEIMLQAAQRFPGQIGLLCCMRPDRMRDIDRARFQPVSGESIIDVTVSASERFMPPLVVRYDDLVQAGYAVRAGGDLSYDAVPIDPDALASLLFTSGTTSISKAVMLSHGNICADIAAVAGFIRFKSGTRELSILPLHHTFENTCGLFMGLAFGFEIIICDGLRYIQKNLQEYSIEMVIGVPTLFENFYRKVQDSLKKSGQEQLVGRMIKISRFLLKLGIDVRRRIFKKIHSAFGGCLAKGICGAAPIDPQVIKFFDDIGFRIFQGYGLTETSPVAAGCNDFIFVPGTVGHPVAGVEIAIDAEAPGDHGEILVRGPIVMKGYYNDPAATAEAIDADGWFHTGDIGMINPKNGCLSIIGRLKSMIVLKNGKKVFPEEIEFLLNRQLGIKESLVWGDEDINGDIVVTAKVIFDRESIEQAGARPNDENALKKYLDSIISEINKLLPSFKSIIRYVYSFQDMVKTTSLKIRRPIEIANIKRLFDSKKMAIREWTGRNLDDLVHDDRDGKPSGSNTKTMPGK